jgi:hypothetical protein
MDVESAEIRAKCFLLFNTNILEVLPAEDNNTSLRNQESELIFLDICQLGELETFDLGSHARSKFRGLEFGVLRIEEVGFGFVSFQPTIHELEWLGWWEFSGFIVDREIVVIFVLWDVDIGSMVGSG